MTEARRAATPDPDAVVASVPGDNTTLSDILAHYADAGYAASWELTDGGDLTCLTCGRTSAPEALGLQSLRRIEGASDPDDMAAVLAVTCVQCGARGTVVVMYGPMSSPQEAELLRRLRDERQDAAVDPHGPAGDATERRIAVDAPVVGDPAPDFAAAASTGHVLDLDAFLHKVPVVMVFCGAPGAVDDVAAAVDRDLAWFGQHRTQALVVSQAPAERVEELRSSGRLRVPVLADPNGDLALHYLGDRETYPTSVVVGLDGDVVALVRGGTAAEHLSRIEHTVTNHLGTDQTV